MRRARANRGQCPLTGLAARFTSDPADNFDIYLPNWLARHNKLIFGTLFVVNELFVLWCWRNDPIFMGRRSIRRQSDCGK